MWVWLCKALCGSLAGSRVLCGLLVVSGSKIALWGRSVALVGSSVVWWVWCWLSGCLWVWFGLVSGLAVGGSGLVSCCGVLCGLLAVVLVWVGVWVGSVLSCCLWVSGGLWCCGSTWLDLVGCFGGVITTWLDFFGLCGGGLVWYAVEN